MPFSNPIIGGGGALVYPAIHSPNFSHANGTGWSINKNGSAEFNNALIRSTVAISGSTVTISPSNPPDLTGNTDTAAIVSAFNNFGAVQLVTGKYYLNQGLVISQDGFSFTGDGWECQLIPVAGSNFDVISNTLTLKHVTLGNFRIVGDNMTGNVADQGNLMHFKGAQFWDIGNVYCDSNYPNWALILDKDINNNISFNNNVHRLDMTNGAAGIYAKSTEADDIHNCTFRFAKSSVTAAQGGSTSAYMLWSPAGDMDVYANVFGSLGGFTTETIRLENGIGSRITHNRFDTCPFQAIHTTAGSNVIVGNSFVDCGANATGVPVILLGSGGNVVNANTFRHLNPVAYTYGVQEVAAFSGNLIEGNVIYQGTTGYVLINAGSTGTVNTGNVEVVS